MTGRRGPEARDCASLCAASDGGFLGRGISMGCAVSSSGRWCWRRRRPTAGPGRLGGALAVPGRVGGGCWQRWRRSCPWLDKRMGRGAGGSAVEKRTRPSSALLSLVVPSKISRPRRAIVHRPIPRIFPSKHRPGTLSRPCYRWANTPGVHCSNSFCPISVSSAPGTLPAPKKTAELAVFLTA